MVFLVNRRQNPAPSTWTCFTDDDFKGVKHIQIPPGACGSLSCILQLLNPPHGCFLCILSTCSRSFMQELKIQPQPVIGSPAGRVGLQPGLFNCLRQVGGFVCSVSLHTCAASRFHTSICLLHHPRSTRRRLAMLDPGPQTIPQGSIYCNRVQPLEQTAIHIIVYISVYVFYSGTDNVTFAIIRLFC